MKNCKIMNSTLFSVKGGRRGFPGYKAYVTGGEGHVFRAPTANGQRAPCPGAAPPNKRSVGVGCRKAAAAGPAPEQGLRVERRGGKRAEPRLSLKVISRRLRAPGNHCHQHRNVMCLTPRALPVPWTLGSVKLKPQFPAFEHSRVPVPQYASPWARLSSWPLCLHEPPWEWPRWSVQGAWPLYRFSQENLPPSMS